MAANGISTLVTKELRQVAKLDIAQAKRQGKVVASDGSITGNINSTKSYYRARNVYDITQLPDTYNDNISSPDDNANIGGLVVGRPWVALQTGIYRTTYTGYHGEDVAFTDTATVTATTTANNFIVSSPPENTTVLYIGYLLASYTGDWTFTLTGDDSSYLWIGANAVSGYTTGNATFANYATTGTLTLALTAGEYYPVRLLYGNGPSSGYLNLTYAHTGQTATNDFTGKLFYNPVTNGI